MEVINHTMPNLPYKGRKEEYQDIIDNGYDFKLGDYMPQSWKIVIKNFNDFLIYFISIPFILIIFFLLYSAISFVIGSLLYICGLKMVTEIFGLICLGVLPFLFYFVLCLSIYEYYTMPEKFEKKDDKFVSFLDAFSHRRQLLPYQLFHSLLVTIIFIIIVLPYNIHDFTEPIKQTINSILPYLSIPILLIITTLIILYSFTSLLIIFGRLTCREAMKISYQITSQKFFSFLQLYFFVAILITLGIMTFGIGLAFTLPLATSVIYLAYNDITRKKTDYLESKIQEIGVNK